MLLRVKVGVIRVTGRSQGLVFGVEVGLLRTKSLLWLGLDLRFGLLLGSRIEITARVKVYAIRVGLGLSGLGDGQG